MLNLPLAVDYFPESEHTVKQAQNNLLKLLYQFKYVELLFIMPEGLWRAAQVAHNLFIPSYKQIGNCMTDVANEVRLNCNKVFKIYNVSDTLQKSFSVSL